jgi:hypothetical protein
MRDATSIGVIYRTHTLTEWDLGAHRATSG